MKNEQFTPGQTAWQMQVIKIISEDLQISRIEANGYYNSLKKQANQLFNACDDSIISAMELISIGDLRNKAALSKANPQSVTK